MEASLWQKCLVRLENELPEQQFNTWIRPLQAVEDDGQLRLLAPNRFVVDWLQEHYVARILEILDGSETGAELVLEVGSRQAPVAMRATPERPPGTSTEPAPPPIASPATRNASL